MFARCNGHELDRRFRSRRRAATPRGNHVGTVQQRADSVPVAWLLRDQGAVAFSQGATPRRTEREGVRLEETRLVGSVKFVETGRSLSSALLKTGAVGELRPRGACRAPPFPVPST
jgi:hypothetical protein